MSDEKEAAVAEQARTPTEAEALQLSIENGTVEVIISFFNFNDGHLMH